MKRFDSKSIAIGIVIGTLCAGTVSVVAAPLVKSIQITYSVNNIVVDGKVLSLKEDSKPFISNDRTFLPVGALAEAFGKKVAWDGNTGTVFIDSVPQSTAQPEKISLPSHSAEQSTLASSILQEINARRKAEGVHNLALDEKLIGCAQLKSDDLVKNNYLSHESPIYGFPSDLLEKFGVPYKTLAENIGFSSVSDAAKLIDKWMDSPAHRQNILNKDFNKLGVGITNKGEELYLVLLFTD